MARRCALLALIFAALATLGCGRDESPPPPGCADAAQGLAALRKAPGAARLANGAALSECVERAFSDGDLQSVGSAFTAMADRLAAEAASSDAAALRMGYLVGATRKGAAHTSGIHAELVRRLEQATLLDDAAPASRQAAYRRGLAAGRARG
jgi:hypothetical protein